MIYEVVIFGSWKRRGILSQYKKSTEVINSKSFGVAGAAFSPLYNINHRLRLGGSVELIYDASANVKYEELMVNSGELSYVYPKFSDRISTGIAFKTDYVMPYFTVSLGLGVEVLRVGEDYSYFYQTLTLKTDLTDRLFFNLGYRIKDFMLPSFLMFGFGYRFGRGFN